MTVDVRADSGSVTQARQLAADLLTAAYRSETAA
jgi:hypothetical protein